MSTKLLFWFWQFPIGMLVTSQEIIQIGTNFNKFMRISLKMIWVLIANAYLFLLLLLPFLFCPDAIGDHTAKSGHPGRFSDVAI